MRSWALYVTHCVSLEDVGTATIVRVQISSARSRGFFDTSCHELSRPSRSDGSNVLPGGKQGAARFPALGWAWLACAFGTMAIDLAKLGRRSFVTQSALAEILQFAEEHHEELKDMGKSRPSIKRARVRAIGDETPFGPVLKEVLAKAEDGTSVGIWLTSPAAMLHRACSECPHFAQFFEKVVDSASQTLTFAIYTDEVTPGNQLKAQNHRKVWSFYWAVQEVGSKVLASEYAWFMGAIVRTNVVSTLAGGLSQVLKHVVHSFFQPGQDFRNGVILPLPSGPRVVCGRIKRVFGDESATKRLWHNKGASGKVLCLFCRTTVQQRYAPAPLGGLVLHTEADPSKFLLHTDRTIYNVIDFLKVEKGLKGKGAFSELEKNLGFNFASEGALNDELVRAEVGPASTTCFDPMHIYLVAGLLHEEITLLLDALKKAKIKQSAVDAFFQEHTWPSLNGKNSGARTSFSKKVDLDDGWKSPAGDCLGVYPVLRSFLASLPREAFTPGLALAVKSYYALAMVLDAVKPALTGTTSAETLMEKIKQHVIAFQAGVVI